MSDEDDDRPSEQGFGTFDVLLRDIARSESKDPPASDELVGSTFGHYRVLGELGRGGMGVVYRARDSRLGRDVALKVLHPALAGDEERRRRFLREARSAAAINHPNIATVYEIGESDGRLFLAMERVEGKTLRARLATESIGELEALQLAQQIARGLSRAHEKGIVHRDLKPENVMLASEGAKILDFGIAKLVEAASSDVVPESGTTLTQQGYVMGTPGYMSPEQATGKAVDARTDVYALGVVLHEMLTGELPGALGSGRVAANPKAAAVVARCLAQAPEKRWDGAGELLAALDEVIASASPERKSRRPARARRVALVLATLVSVGLVAAAMMLARRRTASTLTPLASATTRVPTIGLLEGAAPETKSPQALEEYQRAMTDLRDAVRRPAVSLRRALALDPGFAAASLRLSFDLWPPASTRAYGDAVRARASLDARDQDLLHAEEPRQTKSPPDLVETERRYAVLHDKSPLDVEILLRLAAVREERDPSAGLAAYEEVIASDPTIAAGERGAGFAAARAGNSEQATAHYKRCVEISSMAGRCMEGIGRLSASDDRCEDALTEFGRAAVVDPEDPFLRYAIFNAALGARRTYDECASAARSVASVVQASETARAWNAAQTQGELALWFGSFEEARRQMVRLDDLQEVAFGNRGPQIERELGIAEEEGADGQAAALVRQVVDARRTTSVDSDDDGYEDVILQAARRYHAMSPSVIAQQRDRWVEQGRTAGFSPWKLWLYFDAASALNAEEARRALAHGDDAVVPLRASVGGRVNAQLGRVLLLAGRTAEAAARLELAASSCSPMHGDSGSDAVLIVRAARDLGLAREAMGDTPGACTAYQRVLDRWGTATPRSVTAEEARAHAKRLGCSPVP